ncbi:hypothetical protein ACFLRT_05770 [Acidobacteriota bacterium]
MGSGESALGYMSIKLSKKWWISYYHNGERVREGVSTNKREAEKVLTQRTWENPTTVNRVRQPAAKMKIPMQLNYTQLYTTRLYG